MIFQDLTDPYSLLLALLTPQLYAVLAAAGAVFFVFGLLAGGVFSRRFLKAANDLDAENQKWFDQIEKRKQQSLPQKSTPKPPQKSPRKPSRQRSLQKT